ncbi:MAG: RNA polymerase sigma factor [candidate division Zixibacteria bacterium]|nr:RNA polymerase sigma factor [candidate division Zixibacteria bacterium]
MKKETEIRDNVIVDECRSGNLMKFKVLVERYKKSTYYYALGMIGNPEDAYDLSQEAFVKAYKSLERYDESQSFKNWLFTILSNLCKNALRSTSVRKKYISSSDIAFTYTPASAKTNPEISYIKKETKKLVWEALAKLDNEAKEIIILKHFQDMPYQEIAEVLGIPVGSVMSRLHYARQKLKKALEGKI